MFDDGLNFIIISEENSVVKNKNKNGVQAIQTNFSEIMMERWKKSLKDQIPVYDKQDLIASLEFS